MNTINTHLENSARYYDREADTAKNAHDAHQWRAQAFQARQMILANIEALRQLRTVLHDNEINKEDRKAIAAAIRALGGEA